MSRSSLLADVLTRIRNGQKAHHNYVLSDSSNLVKNCLSVLKQEGYIGDFAEFEERKGVKMLKIDLKYYKGKPVIQSLKMVSKPGCRVYSPVKSVFRSRRGLGIYVMTTSHGVMAARDARIAGVGGEMLFEVF